MQIQEHKFPSGVERNEVKRKRKKNIAQWRTTDWTPGARIPVGLSASGWWQPMSGVPAERKPAPVPRPISSDANQ